MFLKIEQANVSSLLPRLFLNLSHVKSGMFITLRVNIFKLHPTNKSQKHTLITKKKERDMFVYKYKQAKQQ
jgi:hypothetical protein